jgi:RNA polymerase sigma factor (sigma-70 family)
VQRLIYAKHNAKVFRSEIAGDFYYNGDMQAGADRELIEASRRGDHAAFATIIERYQRAVYAVAFSGTRDRALADDIAQDAFVIAWRRLGELREAERLPAWLCGIARNLARDARKRRREVVDVELIDATTPYEAMSEAESERIISTALGQVPDVYREPLVLFYYEERSVKDVAKCLGISAATTNKRLSRGRRYLAERVAIVERGVTRRGASATLAASVLAILAITAPAAHVDASPVKKGSTMHKLAIAATAVATLTAGGVVIATTARSTDARASAPNQEAGPTPASKTADSKHQGHGCGLAIASARPSLPAVFGAKQKHATAAFATNDCGAVGRHLADLEGATGHDQNDPSRCASDYTSICESESWSVERRNCALAADDLLNAHLCAFETGSPDEVIPPALACATIASHITPIVQNAGLYPAGRVGVRQRRVVGRAAPVLCGRAGDRGSPRVHQAGGVIYGQSTTLPTRPSIITTRNDAPASRPSTSFHSGTNTGTTLPGRAPNSSRTRCLASAGSRRARHSCSSIARSAGRTSSNCAMPSRSSTSLACSGSSAAKRRPDPEYSSTASVCGWRYTLPSRCSCVGPTIRANKDFLTRSSNITR